MKQSIRYTQKIKKIVEEIFLLDKSKTLILITHRYETVYDRDQILLIKDGILSYQGKFDYLNNKYNLNAFVKKNKNFLFKL